MNSIEVKMGEVAVTKNPDCLVANGVGSCLIVTLFDPKRRIGGMAHALLSRGSALAPRETKYVEDAIDMLIDKMAGMGSRRADMEAKLAGAANMFSTMDSYASKEMVHAAKQKLKHEHIKIIGESVGGNIGRSVEFDPKSGIVTVKIKF